MRRPVRAMFGALMVAATFVACGSSRPPAPSPNLGAVVPAGRPVPSVPLVDQDGRDVTLQDFRGRYVVFAPFLTLCQEECPITTGAFQEMQSSVRRAGLANQIVFVEATLDPVRDTPARLTAYRQRYGADWTLLTGTPASIASLWKDFGIYDQTVPEGSPPATDWLTGKPLTYDVDHSNGFILIDRSGDERFITNDLPDLKGRLSPQLRSLLDQQGIANLEHPDPGQSFTVGGALSALAWLVGRPLPAPA